MGVLVTALKQYTTAPEAHRPLAEQEGNSTIPKKLRSLHLSKASPWEFQRRLGQHLLKWFQHIILASRKILLDIYCLTC